MCLDPFSADMVLFLSTANKMGYVVAGQEKLFCLTISENMRLIRLITHSHKSVVAGIKKLANLDGTEAKILAAGVVSYLMDLWLVETYLNSNRQHWKDIPGAEDKLDTALADLYAHVAVSADKLCLCLETSFEKLRATIVAPFSQNLPDWLQPTGLEWHKFNTVLQLSNQQADLLQNLQWN